jgi:hypothetical protein
METFETQDEAWSWLVGWVHCFLKNKPTKLLKTLEGVTKRDKTIPKSAGINRLGGADERAAQERTGDPP